LFLIFPLNFPPAKAFKTISVIYNAHLNFASITPVSLPKLGSTSDHPEI
jgi:hypothetical protein